MRWLTGFTLVAVLACSGKDEPPAIAHPEDQAKAPVSSWPPADLRACAEHADCAPAPGCCPAPCTGDVIHKRYLAAARAEVDRTCDRSQECPVAGGCVEHAYMCVQGSCKLVMAGDPEYPVPDE